MTMRILMTQRELIHRAGSELFTIEVATELGKRGHEVAVFCPRIGDLADIIFSAGASVLATLLQQTRTVPIVFVQVFDPVAGGFVSSLARPGGNATGFVTFEYVIAGKWITLLREIAPSVNRITVVQDPLLGVIPTRRLSDSLGIFESLTT